MHLTLESKQPEYVKLDPESPRYSINNYNLTKQNSDHNHDACFYVFIFIGIHYSVFLEISSPLEHASLEHVVQIVLHVVHALLEVCLPGVHVLLEVGLPGIEVVLPGVHPAVKLLFLFRRHGSGHQGEIDENQKSLSLLFKKN